MMTETLSPLIIYPAIALATTFTATILVYFTYPAILFRWYMSYGLYSCGLKVKYVKDDDYTFCYCEKGKPRKDKTTLLFVHGFSASKDMWVPIVKLLPKDLHIVAPDLPGHGHTSRPNDVDFPSQVEKLHEFIELTGLNSRPFHLIGQSMGGALAGLYAAKYPEEVERITMICPAIKTPVESEFFHELRSGHCRLIPQDPDETQRMIDSTMFYKRKIPKQILKAVVELRRPYTEFYTELFQVTANDEHGELLINQLDKVTMSSQVIWGEHDELVHISGFDVMKNGLPNCEMADIIPQCGHSTNMDRPGYVVKLLLQFRGELETKKKK